MTVLITGAAGFIGYHLAQRLAGRGASVVGVDELNAYYDPRLKYYRLANLAACGRFAFTKLDVADAVAFDDFVRRLRPQIIIHLAAQAGVRYSLENPFAYERANVAGHLSVLEAAQRHGVGQIIYASSSSVYGARPLDGAGFSETDPADTPASLYAATKRAAELMSETYAALYGLAQTGLRFFTVYGPMGRPDMAIFNFTEAIMRDRAITVFGEGKLARDFTYIDDVIDGIEGVLDRPGPRGANRIFNIGNNCPVTVNDMIALLEERLGKKAIIEFAPEQKGDVPSTHANIAKLNGLCGYRPKITLEEGIERFVEWHRGADWSSACQQSALRGVTRALEPSI